MAKFGKNSYSLDLSWHKCKQCKKDFECGVNYVYKRMKNDYKSYYYFCSYSCLRAYDKEHEKKRA